MNYEFLSYCKISIPQRQLSIVIGSVPSGTHIMLGINKDHSPNSASLDVTNVVLRWLNVFFIIIKLFVLLFKEKLLLYLMFCLIGTLY